MAKRQTSLYNEHEFDELKRQLLNLDLDYGLSDEVVAENKRKIEAKIQWPISDPDKDGVVKMAPIQLKEESVDDCIYAYEMFDQMTQTDGKKLYYCRKGQEYGAPFEYTLAEKQWIYNEIAMCAASFKYWFFRYFFLKNKANRIVRPDVLVAQLVFLAILADLNRQRLPIKLLVLKARQLGMSTITEAIILWIATFFKGCHCVISSAEEEKSVEMAQMVWTPLERFPLWMRHTLTRDDVSKGPEFAETASDISIQHGAKKKGIARGSTPIAAHLSEVPYYHDPTETVEASLLNAMHEDARMFLVLEGTAKKKGDWWHNLWEKEREGEREGTSQFKLIFLPWYVGRDKYPTADWLRNHPIPDNWQPLKETIKQAKQARLYVATTELLRKHLGEGWEMPIEQMWCWEHRYVNAKRTDESLKKFHAEFASDEKTCFQSRRWSAFAFELLEKLLAQRSEKFHDYALVGDGIAKKFDLKEYQSGSAKRIEIPWVNYEGKGRLWKLIPLRETPTEIKEQFFIRIWEHPKPGYIYSIGIDISGGLGQDATVYEVIRRGMNPGDPDIQVAELWSPWISCVEAAGPALALGIYYGRFMSPVAEAIVAPETQIAVGDFISSQLAEEGYSNFFYMDRWDMRRKPGQRSNRRGWATTSWSKPLMDGGLKHAAETGWIVINSERLLDEMDNMEAEVTDSDKTVYDHAEGEHNDCWTATGIGYCVNHEKDTIVERMKGALKPRRAQQETEDLPEQELDSSEAQMARKFMREDEEAFPSEDTETYDAIF